jgi:hypothetical protein
MPTRNTNYRNDSFLSRSTQINDIFLGLNNLPTVQKTIKDEVYVIGHGYDERPDLLAHQIYGNTRLWWVFAMRNPDVLKDPIRDFRAGTQIILPSEESVQKLVNG